MKRAISLIVLLYVVFSVAFSQVETVESRDKVIILPFQNLSIVTDGDGELPPPPPPGSETLPPPPGSGEETPPPPGVEMGPSDPFKKPGWLTTGIPFVCNCILDDLDIFIVGDMDSLLSAGRSMELFESQGDKIERLTDLSQEERSEIAKYIGAKYVVSGSYVVEENDIKITYSIDEHDGEMISNIVGDVEIAGPKEDVQKYCSELATDLIDRTGVELPSGAVIKDEITDNNLALMWASRCCGLSITGKAIGFASAAIDLDPDFVYAYKLLGDAYRYEDNFEKAEQTYEYAIDLNPDNPDLYIVSGINYYMWGKERNSEIIYVDEELQESIDSVEEFLSSYEFFNDDEEFVEKLNALMDSLSRTSDTIGVINNPDLPDAINIFIGTIYSDELLSDVVSELTALKSEIDNTRVRNKDRIPLPEEYNLAMEQYEKALEIDPYNVSAHIRIAKLDEIMGNRKDAIDRLRTVLEINDRLAEAHNMLGNDLWYYAVETKSQQWRSIFNEAVEHYRKSLDMQPDSPTTHYNIASLYLKLEKATSAIEHFEKYLELKPDASNASDVQTTIENLKAGKY